MACFGLQEFKELSRGLGEQQLCFIFLPHRHLQRAVGRSPEEAYDAAKSQAKEVLVNSGLSDDQAGMRQMCE